MRRVTALLGAAAIVLWTVSAFAQAKPSFAGKWTREAPAGGAPAAGGGGGGRGRGGGGGGAFNCGMTCDITQDGAGITLTRAQGETTVTQKFAFTGESKNTQPGRQGGAPTEIVSKSSWDGNKFVLTTVRDMGGNSITFTQTLSIEGGKLTVVTTSTAEGATPQTVTYTKG
jgi:hypothetical protein